MEKKKKSNVVKYNRWGYIFLIPFTIVFIVFQLIPLISTFWNSFFENYRSGLTQIGPNFIAFDNFKKVFSSGEIWMYAKNTLIMWILGFVPQIFFSLLLGAWFSDKRLNIKGAGFFKTVIYMPNLIMASAFAMLFFTLFSDSGPINSILVNMGILSKPFSFFSSIWATRGLVGFMNFVMWFGNTTLLLMAGMLGIDPSLYEAAEVDGATSTQKFFRITLPILKPILVYVVITSLIGGLQMFDVPNVLTGTNGDPVRSSMTLIMYLNNQLYSKNYGLGGAISVFLFFITAILSFIVFKASNEKEVK
ncbi:MAG: sugar ABC transporter permease [Lachnospiraceae bacterium]|nr:sugar ABC transporter permease [Lachnospiraceae bacterium]